MDHEQPAFPFSPTVRAWIESFAGELMQIDEALWTPPDDLRYGVRPAEGSGEWEVVSLERGVAARQRMRAPAEYAERYLVWVLAGVAQWVLQRRSDDYPDAPWRMPVPDGSLSIEDVGDEVRVTADGEVVARFEGGYSGRSDAVRFTYYGLLPPALLIEQTMGPADAMVFAAGTRYRSSEEEAVLAHRVVDATREALDRWRRPAEERRELELQALPRSPALPVLRLVRQRLRYFSFAAPRPKESEGDSLQVAFAVADPEGQKRLLASLLLAPAPPDEIQRVRIGDDSMTVTVQTGTAWLSAAGEPRTERLVLLRIWDPLHPYDVSPELIDLAVRLEQHFDELGLADRPRQTDLLGFVTAERYPELFEDP